MTNALREALEKVIRKSAVGRPEGRSWVTGPDEVLAALKAELEAALAASEPAREVPLCKPPVMKYIGALIERGRDATALEIGGALLADLAEYQRAVTAPLAKPEAFDARAWLDRESPDWREKGVKNVLVGIANEAYAAGLAASGAQREDWQIAELLLRYRAAYGGPWEAKDVPIFKLLNEIWNDGFEAAHALQPCGHSRGDYRDADYIPGKPETYTASEKCIGCEREARLAAPAVAQAELSKGQLVGILHNYGVHIAADGIDKILADLNAILRPGGG